MTHDLGIFVQSFWSTASFHGLLYNSLEFYQSGMISHLGIHMSPILFLLVPVYMIFPAIETILLTQSILYGLGALPLYLIGIKKIGKAAALTVTICYFLYPALIWSNINEFYELAFLPLLLGFFLYGFLFKRELILLICGIGCLTIKEDISIIVMFASLIGIYYYRKESNLLKLTFIFLLIISLLWLIISWAIIMPSFISEGINISANLFLPQYSNALENVLSDLHMRGTFLLEVFYPLAFLPLFSPEMILLSLPSLIEILFSKSYSDIQYHFTVLIIPIVFTAFIISLEKIKNRLPTTKKYFFSILLVLLIINSLFCCALISPIGKLSTLIDYPNQYRADTHWYQEGIRLIPSDAVLATQSNLYSLFANRPCIIEGYDHDPEYIVIHLGFPECQVFVKDFPEIYQYYTCIYQSNDFYILKRSLSE